MAGALGICIPMFGKVIPAILQDRDAFIVLKTFAAGVILATGFIHVFPDACESLSWPCLTGKAWGSFPFAGFVSMLAAIMTLQICMLANITLDKKALRKARPSGGRR